MNIRHPFVKLAALGVLVTALPLLMAPSGGYPTRPRFQGVGVQTVAPTNGAKILMGTGVTDPGWDPTAGGGVLAGKGSAIFFYQAGQDGIFANNAYFDGTSWRCITTTTSSAWVYANGSINTSHGVCGSPGAVVTQFDDFQVDPATGIITAPGATSVPWTSETTGAITLTYTSGCGSGTATASGKYYKIGHVVTVLITAATLCGTGSSLITFAGMPSAIWPSTAMLATAQVASASGEVSGVAQINNGGPVLIYAAPALTTVSGFTITQSFTYALP